MGQNYTTSPQVLVHASIGQPILGGKLFLATAHTIARHFEPQRKAGNKKKKNNAALNGSFPIPRILLSTKPPKTLGKQLVLEKERWLNRIDKESTPRFSWVEGQARYVFEPLAPKKESTLRGASHSREDFLGNPFVAEIQAAQAWRQKVAHDYKHMDLAMTSLAPRQAKDICVSGAVGRSLSGFQSSTKRWRSRFTPKKGTSLKSV